MQFTKDKCAALSKVEEFKLDVKNAIIKKFQAPQKQITT